MPLLPMLLSGLSRVGGAISRARKAGDDMRNARRRFERKAFRHLKQADKAVGETKKRLQKLAEGEFKEAAKGYDIQSAREKFEQKIKDKTGIDISETVKKARKITRTNYIERSFQKLEGIGLDAEARREAMADELLSNPMIARRIYGATVSIWNAEDESGMKLDYEGRNQAIIDYFGAQDMLEVIERFERMGGLYDEEEGEGEDRYTSFVLRAQKMLRSLSGRGNAQE